MSENNNMEKKIDDLAASVAHGFEELHTRIDNVEKEVRDGFSDIRSEMRSRFDHHSPTPIMYQSQ